MSHGTGNDLESSDILDFSDNCENLDVLMNADQDYWTDRFNNKKPTIDYALRMAGFTPAGFDFTTGGVLKNGDRNKCVFNQADQTWYSWSGDLPYNVIAGSTPGEGWKVVNRSTISSDKVLIKGDKTYTLTMFADANFTPITKYISSGVSHREVFQAAIDAGNCHVPAGVSLNIDGDIVIPSNRIIVVDFGADIVSNGRFTAYGENNVHWIVNGSVRSVGMKPAAAKSGWPNTAEGTQLGDERGFIEFGGVTFAGNDGDNYSVRIGPTGIVCGDWTGIPNFSDQVRQVNRKGIAAWNCSNVHFESDGDIYGFEGEAVYWFSRNVVSRNVYMRVKKLHDCRFNGLNVNSLLAFENIKIEKSVTKNTYQGIESSAGDVIDCRDYFSMKHAIYAGQGHGGGKRKISGNQSFGCLGTPFSIIYNKDYESLGRVKDVIFTNNHAVDSADGFLSISDIENIQAMGNSCHGMKAGRFIQVTGCLGGNVSSNNNVKPGNGTTHIYRAENYSVYFTDNERVNVGGGDYTTADSKTDGFIGGKSAAILTHGNRENFQDMYCPAGIVGVGGEYRYSYGDGIHFVGVSVNSWLTASDSNGVRAEWRVNNLKYNTDDTLGTSLRVTDHGDVLPGTNGTQNVGSASLPWNQIFAAVGSIQPSDRRIKEQIETIPDLALDAYASISHKRFKYKDAVNDKKEKGEEARWHTGIIAQDIKEAFELVGLDATEYGLLCYNSWPDIYDPVLETIEINGEVITRDTGEVRLVMAAGDRWSIRPDECAFMEAALQRRNYQRLIDRLELLESK